jgi:hypothetical protein
MHTSASPLGDLQPAVAAAVEILREAFTATGHPETMFVLLLITDNSTHHGLGVASNLCPAGVRELCAIVGNPEATEVSNTIAVDVDGNEHRLQ